MAPADSVVPATRCAACASIHHGGAMKKSKVLVGSLALWSVCTLPEAAYSINCTAPPPRCSSSAAAFEGKAVISCFGCGASSGTATLNATGQVNNFTGTDAATAAYTVFEGTGADCVISGE